MPAIIFVAMFKRVSEFVKRSDFTGWKWSRIIPKRPAAASPYASSHGQTRAASAVLYQAELLFQHDPKHAIVGAGVASAH
jgi:hypothetical protein